MGQQRHDTVLELKMALSRAGDKQTEVIRRAADDELIEGYVGADTSEYGRSILMTFLDRPVDLLWFDKGTAPEMTV